MRALLATMVIAVVITQVCRHKEIEPLWTETLMIVMAHYFTSRRFINFDPTTLRKLELEGHVESDATPLFLPKRVVKVLIFVAFMGLAIYAYQTKHLLDPTTLSVLGVVAAYLGGVVTHTVITWWKDDEDDKPVTTKNKAVRGWEDMKAGTVLLVLAFTAIAHLLDHQEIVPHFLRNTTLALVLFYFGSR